MDGQGEFIIPSFYRLILNFLSLTKFWNLSRMLSHFSVPRIAIRTTQFHPLNDWDSYLCSSIIMSALWDSNQESTLSHKPIDLKLS